ncbi:MAG: nucleoside triphosphate pyrophosphohydrolase [Chloroflexi bacterium]|nr:nucleoside triphosphate pyrophosphohydrolase [Chloroflexota bacterium]
MSDRPQDQFPHSYEGLLQLIERLRGPDGCPWDREQTRESLKRQLIEECYELVEAIEENDVAKLVEEIGDVLFHLIFQIRIGEEKGEFTNEQVMGALIEKLVRRHPHVFGDVKVKDSDEVLANWQVIKQAEKMDGPGEASLLDGIPRQTPSLMYAQEIHKRAARVGFDWNDFQGVLDKVAEELEELENTQSDEEREQEFGDLMLMMVNAARWLGVDAESALRKANAKFYRRFAAMERLSRERGLSFPDLSLDEKEALWQEAKGFE